MSTLRRAVRIFEPIVRARRALFGPKRPMWSSELETVVGLLRLFAPTSVFLPLAMQRKLYEEPWPEKDALQGTKIRRVSAGGVPAAWVCQAEAPKDRVLIYLHGGGYTTGSLQSHHHLFCRLSKLANARVLGLDYRLAPEHPFPAPVDDVVAAYRWLLSRGYSAERIGIVGDSAGGGLSLASLLRLRDEGLPLPGAAATLSAWIDLGQGESKRPNRRFDYVSEFVLKRSASHYVKPADHRHPEVSPLYADLKGLPPLMVQVGTAEAFLEDNLRFADRANNAGVHVELDTWPDMVHAWQFFAPFLEEGQHALERIGEFFNRHLSFDHAAPQPAVFRRDSERPSVAQDRTSQIPAL